MPSKKRKPNSRKRSALILISVLILLVIVGIAAVLVTRKNTEGIAANQPAEKTVQTIKAHVSAEQIPYSSSPYRYAQNSGAYMRPVMLPGYKYMVFPTKAYLLKLNSGSNDQAKIESLLGKGFTKKVLAAKSVHEAVEYDSKLVVCYLEVPDASLNQVTIFGCADMLNYAQNAYKIKPFADLSRWVGGSGVAFDTPFTHSSAKPGYEVAFLPATATPGDIVDSKDPMQRYELSTVNVAFYRTPSTDTWVLIGYGGFTRVDQLCNSQYTQTNDIQTALEDVCKSQSWN